MSVPPPASFHLSALQMLKSYCGIPPLMRHAITPNIQPEKLPHVVNRPPPSLASTPMAAFKTAPTISTGLASLMPHAEGSLALTADPAAGDQCPLSEACCDIFIMESIHHGIMSLDGNLLSVSYRKGWKLRDPGLESLTISDDQKREGDEVPALEDNVTAYQHGLFQFATHVCSDSANALVWCAADGGKRIKAFVANGIEPSNVDAGCNRGDRDGMPLQYTLSSDITGAGSEHAGLHVLGTKVMCIKGGSSSSGSAHCMSVAAEIPVVFCRILQTMRCTWFIYLY